MQTFDALELAQVIGNKNVILSQSMRGNPEIVFSDDLALCPKIFLYASISLSGLNGQGQWLEGLDEFPDSMLIVLAPR